MSHLVYNQPGNYVICVSGALDANQSERLGGLSITVSEAAGDQEGPVSVLTGWLSDQASLCGVITTLYNNRFPLLYIKYLGAAQQMATEDLTDQQ